jgi:hypothetical protein
MDSVDFASEFATALNPLRIFQGLTQRQEVYALARFRGDGQRDAYKEAYGDEEKDPEAIRRRAHDLDRHPAIVARVHQLTSERMKKSSLLADLSPEFVTDGIMRIAMFGSKESVQLQAYALLGKVAGIDLFRETTRVERVDRTAEDVDKELKAKLQAMMAGLTIEGNANAKALEPGAAPSKPQPVSAKRDRRRKPAPR